VGEARPVGLLRREVDGRRYNEVPPQDERSQRRGIERGERRREVARRERVDEVELAHASEGAQDVDDALIAKRADECELFDLGDRCHVERGWREVARREQVEGDGRGRARVEGENGDLDVAQPRVAGEEGEAVRDEVQRVELGEEDAEAEGVERVGGDGGDGVVRQEERGCHPVDGVDLLDGGEEGEGLDERVVEGRLEGEDRLGRLAQVEGQAAHVAAELRRGLDRVDKAVELLDRGDLDAGELGGARVGEEAAREGRGRVGDEVAEDVGEYLGGQVAESIPAWRYHRRARFSLAG